MSTTTLGFVHRGETGTISVDVSRVDDADRYGALPGATGLAACRAEVGYPFRGYAGFFGWVQVVRSTDDAGGGAAFGTDPLEMLGTVSHPFAFFGPNPTLFDAPSRDHRQDLDWEAHAFLTTVRWADGPVVESLAGFSWGFQIRRRVVTAVGPVALGPGAWARHHPLLRSAHPGWSFG